MCFTEDGEGQHDILAQSIFYFSISSVAWNKKRKPFLGFAETAKLWCNWGPSWTNNRVAVVWRRKGEEKGVAWKIKLTAKDGLNL